MMPTSRLLHAALLLLAVLTPANAYWLMGLGTIVTERLDPIVNPGGISGHVHTVMGGSNFGFQLSTASLRKSQCTSAPISQDHSNYWFPMEKWEFYELDRWWRSLYEIFSFDGNECLDTTFVDYLFSENEKTTAFPDDFRMLAGDPTLRTYDASSHEQQAVTFLCLDFHGTSSKHNELPLNQVCPDGIRAQINFPSCWDGKNVDSPNHKSHVAYLSDGPDSGTCSDSRFPVKLPRIFMEVYWGTHDLDPSRSQAMNPTQPYVFSMGDNTGYGYHADFFNGWDAGVLQNAVDHCNCNAFGDPTCCAQAGIFNFNKDGNTCHITPQVDEVVTGTLPKLPGNNPVQGAQAAVNGHVPSHPDTNPPQALYPPSAYTGNAPPAGACSAGGALGSKCSRGPVPEGSAPPPAAVAAAPSAGAAAPAPPKTPSASPAPSNAGSASPAPVPPKAPSASPASPALSKAPSASPAPSAPSNAGAPPAPPKAPAASPPPVKAPAASPAPSAVPSQPVGSPPVHDTPPSPGHAASGSNDGTSHQVSGSSSSSSGTHSSDSEGPRHNNPGSCYSGPRHWNKSHSHKHAHAAHRRHSIY